MKTKNFFMLFLVIFLTKSMTSQVQNPFWADQNQILNFTTGFGQPISNSGCSGNFLSPLNYVDPIAGNPFYVDANNIGYCNAPLNYSTVNGNENSERVLIPVPNNCGQYFLIYPDYIGANTQNIYWLKYDAKINAIIQGPTLMATNTGSRIGLAAAPVGVNSFTYLYTVMPNGLTPGGSSIWGLAKWLVTSNGISFDSNLHNSFTNRDLYSPMEADMSHDGNKIAWGNAMSIPSSRAVVCIFDIAQSSLVNHYIGDMAYRVSGLEFASNGKLYVGVRGCNGCTPQGGIYVINSIFSIWGPFGGTDYNRSFLELGYSPTGVELIYAVKFDGTKLGYLNTTNNLMTANIISVNGLKHRNLNDVYVLPDQIDGSDYNVQHATIDLSLTSTSSLCDGDPLTFNGSITQGYSTGYYWEIAESDAAGNPNGGYVWNSHYIGVPTGSYTFPTLPLVCGKFYKVKLAAYNECTPWSETSTVIKINCNPTVVLNDVTLCEGDNFPVILCSGFSKGYSFNWTNNGVTVGTASCLTVYNEGTYCVTVTKNSTGCSSIQSCATVAYDPRMQCTPEFIALSACDGSSPNFNVTATFPLLCEGMSYYWEVCEIEAGTGNLINCSTNPPAWWTGGTTLNFPGYTFVQGHSYQIVRGIWSVPDNCVPWQAHVATPVTCNAGGRNGVYSSVLDKSIKQPTTSSLNNLEFSIYPNPTTGDFTANVEQFTAGDLIQVLDYSGKVVLEKNINTNKIDLNIAEMANGLYFVKVISAHGISMEKLIKN